MKLSEECFKKVKKDCFKFIKSQETSTEKFGNKQGMIKNYLIPICFWIAKKADNKKPYFVGLAGGQGTGKTTISSIIKIILEKYSSENIENNQNNFINTISNYINSLEEDKDSKKIINYNETLDFIKKNPSYVFN